MMGAQRTASPVRASDPPSRLALRFAQVIAIREPTEGEAQAGHEPWLMQLSAEVLEERANVAGTLRLWQITPCWSWCSPNNPDGPQRLGLLHVPALGRSFPPR